MGVPIPCYLEKYAKEIRQKKEEVKFNIVCECESNEFLVFKNVIDTKINKECKEWDKAYHDYWKKFKIPIFSFFYYIDKNDGKMYEYGKNLFGFKVGKRVVPELPRMDNTVIIKIKCSKCGKELILFDNRIHGYNAFAESIKDISYDNINYKQRKSGGLEQQSIQVIINNMDSLEEFIKSIGENVDFDTYSNAFGSIEIIGINNKRTTIYAEETA